jgi:Glycosyltransferases involved in cell wall biogenesis
MKTKTGNIAPSVSVYIPTKNRLELLKRALESVLTQSYPNIEIVVADDGSSDGTRLYLEKLSQKSKVRAIFMPASAGACVARNFAVTSSTGDFVTGLDDDDYFEVDRVSNFVEKWYGLDKSYGPVAGLFDGMQVVRRNERLLVGFPPQADKAQLKIANIVGNQIFAPREHFIGAGLFDNSLPCWQDWDMWLRMAKLYGEFVNCGNASYVMDLGGTSDRISTRPEFSIRYGFRLFRSKHGPYSFREYAGLVNALCDYPQVKLHLSEFVALAGSGRLFALSRKLARLFLTESTYSAVRNRYVSRPTNSV